MLIKRLIKFDELIIRLIKIPQAEVISLVWQMNRSGPKKVGDAQKYPRCFAQSINENGGVYQNGKKGCKKDWRLWDHSHAFSFREFLQCRT